MCGSEPAWDFGRVAPQLLDSLLKPTYRHTVFVRGRGWGQTAAQHGFDEHYLAASNVFNFHFHLGADDHVDDRPLGDIIHERYGDEIGRSDHAPDDNHRSLRFRTALPGGARRLDVDW